jgi:Polyketide cyclase / dehydrase and lipid transport
MKVDVITETIIERPLTEVADFSANPDNAPKWYVNIKSVEWKTQPPVQVGSRVAFVAHFLGKRLAYTYEFIEFVRHQRLIMRTAEGPFPMETTYIWEKVDKAKTRMMLRNKGNPTGFSRLFAPIMVWAMRRANQKDLLKLKKILEGDL